MDKSPVLCVHGIDDKSASFEPMIKALRAREFKYILAMDLKPPDGSITIEEMAGQVKQAAEKLLVDSRADRIDIIAFSMGSLASRYFIQRLGGSLCVRRFIAISGPHHGTLTAYLRQTSGVRQMRPGSVLLKELAGDLQSWGKVQVFSFWTWMDLMICPAWSSRIEGAVQRVFSVPLHPWMFTDRKVIEVVVQTLLAP
jgi:triacylglycerol lipase